MSTRIETKKASRKRSKRENDAYALEMVAVRARERRNARIRHRVIAVAVVVAVVAGGTAGGWFVWSSADLATYAGPKNMRSDGVLLKGSGSAVTATTTRALAPKAEPVATNQTKLTDTANFVLYLDLADATSAAFLKSQGSSLTSWLTAGYVTVEVHPLSAHDSAKDGHWSLRSANAIACVGNTSPTLTLTVAEALAKKAAAKGFDGLSDAQLVAAVRKAGASSATIATCIRDQRFVRWVGLATDRATEAAIPNSSLKRISSTPAVLLNKTRYTGDVTSTEKFTAFIEKVYAATSSSSDSADASGG